MIENSMVLYTDEEFNKRFGDDEPSDWSHEDYFDEDTAMEAYYAEKYPEDNE